MSSDPANHSTEGPAFGRRLRWVVLILVTSLAPSLLSRQDSSPHSAPDQFALAGSSPQALLTNPILFVTQVPVPADFTTIASTFGNHDGSTAAAGRGGDLYILYPDGTLKNLTQAAGFGTPGMQGAGAIAVREPSVHWSGNKAIFSMVVGAPRQYETPLRYWQLYEVTGLGQADRKSVV